MQQKLVSVITPFKNTDKYLKECIESLIGQTYANWELIAVNDHSTDNSFKIVEEYAKKDSRIKLFDNYGNGIIEALRTAFAKSAGNMITRMDSDDIMTPDKLQILVGNLTERGVGNVAIGQVRYFSEVGISDGYARYEKWLNALIAKGICYEEIYKECSIPSPNWLVYKEDLIKCGAFDLDFYPEDYDLTFRFYKYGLKCIPCEQVTHHWRDYSSRTSRTNEHYTNNYFLDIKLRYFLELDYDSKRPLTVWGAGTKGKTIANHLVNKSVLFHWICDNPKKIGHKIYDQELLNFNMLTGFENPQSIITVANEGAQLEILDYMNKQRMQPMKDYFFFC